MTRKFYIVQSKVNRRPAAITVVNKEDVFSGTTHRTFFPPGSLNRGFREYPVKPRFHIDTRIGRKLHEIERYGGYWLLSDRAKKILIDISKSDFAFLQIDASMDENMETVTMWLCDVLPVIDAVDESRSNVKIVTGDTGERIHEIIANGSLIFNRVVVGSHHIFRLTTSFSTIVCDEEFKIAVRESGLTGRRFQDASAF